MISFDDSGCLWYKLLCYSSCVLSNISSYLILLVILSLLIQLNLKLPKIFDFFFLYGMNQYGNFGFFHDSNWFIEGLKPSKWIKKLSGIIQTASSPKAFTTLSIYENSSYCLSMEERKYSIVKCGIVGDVLKIEIGDDMLILSTKEKSHSNFSYVAKYNYLESKCCFNSKVTCWFIPWKKQG